MGGSPHSAKRALASSEGLITSPSSRAISSSTCFSRRCSVPKNLVITEPILRQARVCVVVAQKQPVFRLAR